MEGWSHWGLGGISKPGKEVALKAERDAVVTGDCWNHSLGFREHEEVVSRRERSQKSLNLKESDL